MDLIFRQANLPGRSTPADVGLLNGKIAAIEPTLAAQAPEEIPAHGLLISPGFVDSHLHLDKSCILERCKREKGDLQEAISEVSRVKAKFTAEDVYQRAKGTLERCILQGTTHIRSQLEVDPGIGLRGLEGVLPLIREYAWAVDLEICVFPQEGMLNNPGTEELMVEAVKRGCTVLGACPYTDSDANAQIDRIFELARELDTDIDMHLDFSLDCSHLDVDYVCRQTEAFGYGGRVTVGHVSKLSALAPQAFSAAARRLKDAGVAVTVLPATDLYLMGRPRECDVPRGVTQAHKLLECGVNCSIATNNVLNPFTPFGDCSLLRVANLYANTCQVGTPQGAAECFQMVTGRAAVLMNLKGYGLEVGHWADLVLLDCETPAAAVAEVAPVLAVYKRGVKTVTRPRPTLHR